MRKFYSISATLVIVTLLVFTGCKKDAKTITKDISKTNIEPTSQTAIIRAYPANVGEYITYNMKDGTKIILQKVNDDYILGGDILLTDNQLRLIKENSVQGNQSVRNTVKTRSTFLSNFMSLWPTGKLYYTINTTANLANINAAIAYWNNNTQVQLIPRTNQTNYVEFAGVPLMGGGDSRYGMVGGKQQIRLVNGIDIGGVIHEIGHTLGLLHEHTRSDRGLYINVNTSNINSDWASQYQIYSGINGFGFEIGTFDFDSIMLYPSDNPDARVNGNPAPQMTTLVGGYSFAQQRDHLSTGDIAAINYLYFNNTFCRLRLVPTETVEDSYRSHIVYEVHADFFSNIQCTIPKTLANPIQFRVNTQNTVYYSTNTPTISISSGMQLLSSGSNSYLISIANVDQDYNFTYDGDVVAGSYSNVMGIAGGQGYIGVN